MKHLQPTKLWLRKYRDEHDIDTDAIDALMDEINPILEKHGFMSSMSETFSIGIVKNSIYECEDCGQIFVNRDENPAGLDKDYLPEDINIIIYDGGSHDGKQICELCLPHTHRWGHSS